MSNARLTDADRRAIIARVTEPVIGPERKALKEREHKLAVRAVKEAAGRHYDTYLRMPHALQVWDPTYVRLEARGGKRWSLQLPGDHPGINAEHEPSRALAEAVTVHHDRVDDLYRRERILYGKVGAILNSVQTYKRLAEVWPEGAEFYAQPAAPDTAAVNTLIGKGQRKGAKP